MTIPMSSQPPMLSLQRLGGSTSGNSSGNTNCRFAHADLSSVLLGGQTKHGDDQLVTYHAAEKSFYLSSSLGSLSGSSSSVSGKSSSNSSSDSSTSQGSKNSGSQNKSVQKIAYTQNVYTKNDCTFLRATVVVCHDQRRGYQAERIVVRRN
jgi:hypothetical protein